LLHKLIYFDKHEDHFCVLFSIHQLSILLLTRNSISDLSAGFLDDIRSRCESEGLARTA
jgi:hypothetical protein